MNTMIKGFSILVLLFLSVSCATTPPAIPDKYNLDNELESIDQIPKYKVTSWENVDRQSVILRANTSDYYLLVLHRPIAGVITSEKIGISSTVSSIKAGYDKIFVKESGSMDYYIIDKIYKLKGRDQARKIKEQLRKNVKS